MNYIELIVAIFVSTLILLSALNILSEVLLHVSSTISTNAKSLRMFHILNYIKLDFTKHALSNPKSKVSNVLISQSSFSFYEAIDGETKKIIYKSVISPSGKCHIFRDTYVNNGLNYEFVNRRAYDLLSDKIKFEISKDNKFIIIRNDMYGNVIIPRNPPGVRITGIIVKKTYSK